MGEGGSKSSEAKRGAGWKVGVRGRKEIGGRGNDPNSERLVRGFGIKRRSEE